MARKVKCYITGESGTNDIFFKGQVGKLSKYFKDESVYNEWKKDKESKSHLINLVSEMIFDNGIVPPMFISKLKSLEYPENLIYECIRQNKASFDYANTKEFNNIFQKTSYIIAIIKNNISTVKIIEPKSTDGNYVELDIINANIKSTATNQRKDISIFLED